MKFPTRDEIAWNTLHNWRVVIVTRVHVITKCVNYGILGASSDSSGEYFIIMQLHIVDFNPFLGADQDLHWLQATTTLASAENVFALEANTCVLRK